MDLLLEIAADDGSDLGEQDVSRCVAVGLLPVVAGQIPGHLEYQLLEAPALAIRVEVHALEATRADERGTAGIARKPGLHLHLGRDVHRVKAERSDVVPIDLQAMPNPLHVALDSGEPDLEIGPVRKRVDRPDLRRRA